MTEDQAKAVVLLQALETAASPHWSSTDAQWATAQAVATAGPAATPAQFVVARASQALSRLLPRDSALQRWLQRRWWRAAWLPLAAALGLMAGLVVDQLGPPQQVNLLAPAVWAVVAWNLVVYAALAWPQSRGRDGGWRDTLSSALLNWKARDAGLASVNATWAAVVAPLTVQRLTLLMHTAAAGLALGLMAGLYLRGLVLDYRIGWQSTFASTAAVQQALAVLLAPASALTGITLPDVAPLQLAPGQAAQASAALWIHLFVATLLLWVVLPRTLLAWLAAWRARRISSNFALTLDTPYFEALHPLMRPGPPRVLRLLWVSSTPLLPLRLFDQSERSLAQPLTLLRSEQGDELQLHAPPAALQGDVPAPRPLPWWRRGWPVADPAQRELAALARRIDAVLLCQPSAASPPAWLASLGRPVLVLLDSPTATPPQLSLHALDDGWLRQGRLLQELTHVLSGDARVQRLAQAWRVREQARLDAALAVLATSLGRIASAQVELGQAGAASANEAAARQALSQALQCELQDSHQRLCAALGHSEPAAFDGTGQDAIATVHARVSEGRAALLGGAASGALMGLKADLLSGGLTMGAGLVSGLVLGALGSAGVARGMNAARGTERSVAAWGNEVMDRLAAQLLAQHLVLAHGVAPALAAQRVWVLGKDAWSDLWLTRDLKAPAATQAERLAQALQTRLAMQVRQLLGGP